MFGLTSGVLLGHWSGHEAPERLHPFLLFLCVLTGEDVLPIRGGDGDAGVPLVPFYPSRETFRHLITALCTADKHSALFIGVLQIYNVVYRIVTSQTPPSLTPMYGQAPQY